MKSLLLLLCVLGGNLVAASPLFHAVIAEKWLEAFENYDEADKRSFMLGALFPDIRYSAKISREKTHEFGLTIEQIRDTEDPFLKGMRVHNLTDEIRDRYLCSIQFVELYSEFPGDKVFFSKVLEDEILYAMRGKEASQYICEYFESIEEMEFALAPEDSIHKWHAMHCNYFAMSPGDFFEFLTQFRQDFASFSHATIELFSDYLPLYRENPEIKEVLKKTLAEFDRVFGRVFARVSARVVSQERSYPYLLGPKPAGCNEICYNSPSRYTGSGQQAQCDGNVAAGFGIETLEDLLQWIKTQFSFESDRGASIGTRTTGDIIASRKFFCGHDVAQLFITMVRLLGIPAIQLEASSLTWSKDCVQGIERAAKGRVFAEVYLDGGWRLFDPITGWNLMDYDLLNPFIPFYTEEEGEGFFAIAKGFDCWDYGVFSLEDCMRLQKKYAHFLLNR